MSRQSRNVGWQESISGSLVTLFLFDVADEIRLEELRRILQAPPAARKPAFRQPAPEYVQFASPPVLDAIEGCTLSGGNWTGGQIAYYGYGAVSLKLEMPFAGSWQDLIALSARWMNDAELEGKAREVLEARLAARRPRWSIRIRRCSARTTLSFICTRSGVPATESRRPI